MRKHPEQGDTPKQLPKNSARLQDKRYKQQQTRVSSIEVLSSSSFTSVDWSRACVFVKVSCYMTVASADL